MKIKTKQVPLEYALAAPKPKAKKPKKPNILFSTLIRLLAIPDLWATKFTYTKSRMDKAGKGPYLILMNHSSFIDLKIAYKLFYPMPFCTICTSDGFVGKSWLMRKIGCIPTLKFVTDLTLVKDMLHITKNKKVSILMYPEASYTFDGTATPLPQKLGTIFKKLDIPVLTVMTEGAFLRDPLYNGLQLRKAKVSAHLHCLLTRDEIKEKSVEEIDEILKDAFTFDNFARQYETKTEITEAFRADGLHRILYKCACCGAEGKMVGSGTTLTCNECGKSWHMNTLGRLEAQNGKTEFNHIPDWYAWQRDCVKKELESDTYRLDTEVNIGIMRNYKAIYMVGDGRLTHDTDGFKLTGCDGKLNYEHAPTKSYGLYADYFWYEIGDVISIGNKDAIYYCFPKENAIVAKARLAAEELYKIKKQTKTTMTAGVKNG